MCLLLCDDFVVFDSVSNQQSAFAYTAVIPDTDPDDDVSNNHRESPQELHNEQKQKQVPARRMVTVRRLRVSTLRTEASSRVGVVAEMADPATVASVLAHKVVSEARRR